MLSAGRDGKDGPGLRLEAIQPATYAAVTPSLSAADA
jgi:hypothetical protein